jgi:hypothetical protein
MKKAGKLGFTNTLAVFLVIFLAAGLIGGFYLAVRSINADYNGALYCWTAIFAPIGTGISVVLSKIVEKSKAENIKGGIKYEEAQNNWSRNSPPI